MFSSLTIDFTAFWIAVLLIPFFFWIKKRMDSSQVPFLYFSNLAVLKSFQQTGRANWVSFSPALKQLAFLLFLIAWIDPHFRTLRSDSKTAGDSHTPSEGIALYLLLDRSGSMAEKVVAVIDGKKQSISKADLLRDVTKEFILNRPSDLIGLVAFARLPIILSPLTLDHSLLEKKLDEFQIVQNKQEDGTAIGYAIFKTVAAIDATRHFANQVPSNERAPYEIKNTAIVVVTDGFQAPNPLDQGHRLRTLDLEAAADYAKELNIHLYIISVDPGFSSPDLAPHRRLLQRVTELTQGRFYLLNENQDLQSIYNEIDQLEKGEFPNLIEGKKPLDYRSFSLYPLLISLGLLCLALAFFLETIIVRTIP
jgi:Ca-activated chloride channel homolog